MRAELASCYDGGRQMHTPDIVSMHVCVFLCGGVSTPGEINVVYLLANFGIG